MFPTTWIGPPRQPVSHDLQEVRVGAPRPAAPGPLVLSLLPAARPYLPKRERAGQAGRQRSPAARCLPPHRVMQDRLKLPAFRCGGHSTRVGPPMRRRLAVSLSQPALLQIGVRALPTTLQKPPARYWTRTDLVFPRERGHPAIVPETPGRPAQAQWPSGGSAQIPTQSVKTR